MILKRRRMPSTRPSVTTRVNHVGEMDLYITVGFFQPQQKETEADVFSYRQPGEVFIKIGKEGSTMAGLMDIIGVLMSLLLQYNVSWAQISRKLRDTNFEPSNAEGKSIAHSVVAAVDKILEERGSVSDRGYY